MARPRKVVDENIVVKLAEIHCTMEEIASVVGCSVDTLERRFAESIKAARDRGRSSLRRAQWEMAQKGNATMLIWLGKQLLGQRDKRDEILQIESRNEESALAEFRKVLNDSKNERASQAPNSVIASPQNQRQ